MRKQFFKFDVNPTHTRLLNPGPVKSCHNHNFFLIFPRLHSIFCYILRTAKNEAIHLSTAVNHSEDSSTKWPMKVEKDPQKKFHLLFSSTLYTLHS